MGSVGFYYVPLIIFDLYTLKGIYGLGGLISMIGPPGRNNEVPLLMP